MRRSNECKGCPFSGEPAAAAEADDDDDDDAAGETGKLMGKCHMEIKSQLKPKVIKQTPTDK